MSCDLYRFFDKDERLLYVGISLHAARRASQHKKTQPWWQTVARMDVEHLDVDRKDAEEIERLTIGAEGPIHNVVHNRQSSATLTANASPAKSELVGMYVLTPDEEKGWPLCCKQGFVEARVEEDMYLVTWCSWLHGGPTHSEVVDVTEFQTWRIWREADDWVAAADRASNLRERLTGQ